MNRNAGDLTRRPGAGPRPVKSGIAERISDLRNSMAVRRSDAKEERNRLIRAEVENIINRRTSDTTRHVRDVCRSADAFIEERIRALGTGTNGSGSVLIPDDIAPTIISLVEQFGAMRRYAGIVPMKRDIKTIGRRTAGLTANFTNENAVPAEMTLAFDNISLAAKKIAVLTKFSTELGEDAAIETGANFIREVALAFASKEDDCGVNGTGASTYGGIRGISVLAADGNHNAGKYTAAAGHNTFALIDSTDITGVMGLLPGYAQPNAGWYVSQAGFSYSLCRLAAAGAGLMMPIEDPATGETVLSYLGYPIRLVQKLPQVNTTIAGQAMLFFGDLSLAASFGDRREMRVKFLTERFAEFDQIGVIGTERFDFNAHDVGDNASAGPLVALVAP